MGGPLPRPYSASPYQPSTSPPERAAGSLRGRKDCSSEASSTRGTSPPSLSSPKKLDPVVVRGGGGSPLAGGGGAPTCSSVTGASTRWSRRRSPEAGSALPRLDLLLPPPDVQPGWGLILSFRRCLPASVSGQGCAAAAPLAGGPARLGPVSGGCSDCSGSAVCCREQGAGKLVPVSRPMTA
ncbi:hypothetical protein SETIT_8G151800v2 [Setaria italica]|uniref:Uncharacterized protein n=1 Tax=Setaria italica TaxID=4555 RepID=A0A368S882_SETIT|nr:hypothetical protein SETIT_8G151800v2 [Setaria italica]RCV38553.1 hypothetical protein SETIT_8G151800v2 [Setaria italica]